MPRPDPSTSALDVIRRALSIALCLLASAPALACSIVYGKDWAFTSEIPERWSGACHTEAMAGTAMTLWPSAQRPDQADALIYVTVSARDLPSIGAFAADEQSRTREASPQSVVALDATVTRRDGIQVVSVSKAAGGREELVAYVEGPTAYFVIVLTATSESALSARRPGFVKFLESFRPMERK